ncbi:reverse transcriptase domain-containing protein [Tanacetum coccineum]
MKGILQCKSHIKKWEKLSAGPINNYGFTSWCNMGFYDIDFGWGKQSWATGLVCDGALVFMNLVTLMDKKCGGGIEAWVNLEEQDMKNLRGNQELLAWSFNKFTWYKNKALYTRIVAYSDPTRPVLTFVSTSWRHSWDPTLGITLVRMSMMGNATLIVTTVIKNTNKEKAPDAAPRVNIQDFCEEHYEDILPIIMEKARRDKRKEVQTILNFGENSKKTRRERENSLNSRAENSPARFYPEKSRTRGRERRDDRNVFSLLSHRRKSVHERGTKTKYRDRSRNIKRFRESESPSSHRSESSTSNGGHWKSRTKRRKLVDEDDLAEPRTCEDVDPFTPRIRNFKSLRKTRMPNNVKTYNGTGDPEDHLKIFQAVAQVECWAMPTWCHMFNSTLIGATRKKYVKDPVEIHNIKQRDEETIKDFIERFKVETGRIKGAPECMRISGFMHRVNNPELTKRLNEHVLKTMEEMMTITTAFIRGESTAASKKKGHSSWKSQDQSKRHAPE